jgi:hypothetical protein
VRRVAETSHPPKYQFWTKKAHWGSVFSGGECAAGKRGRNVAPPHPQNIDFMGFWTKKAQECIFEFRKKMFIHSFIHPQQIK